MRRPELNFPTGLKIGPKVMRFNEAEVDAWLASRGGAV
jgi:predicted DNA-binding transcriptional regulator AlpA